MRVKKESERANLRLNIKKTKIMASSHITEWQTEGENLEVVADFLFLGSKIMMDRDFSLEIKKKKKTISSWQKSSDKPRQYVEKQRHYSAHKSPL